MMNKILIIMLYPMLIFCGSCKGDFNSCSMQMAEEDLFLYIDSLLPKCEYQLSSNFLGPNFRGWLKENDSIVEIKFSIDEKYQKFIEKNGLIGQKMIIPYKFIEPNLSQTYEGDYSFKLDTIVNKNIYIFKIYNILDFTKMPDTINATVFYQKNKGFIGSYLEYLKEPNWIVMRRGNILQEEIDYSGRKFGDIR